MISFTAADVERFLAEDMASRSSCSVKKTTWPAHESLSRERQANSDVP
jgi:hypothetical protein